MARNTKIEWADDTLNFINGCEVLSPGCTNCYAMQLAGTRMKHTESRKGLTQLTKSGKPVWNGSVRYHMPHLLQAMKWQKPRRIFWNAHGDMFLGAVPMQWIDMQFAIMAVTPQHTHMILSKRTKRMRLYLNDPETPRRVAAVLAEFGDLLRVTGPKLLAALAKRAHESDPETVVWPIPNLWVGTSVEDQERADQRVPDLLASPAAIRFLSCEPLLGPVQISEYLPNPRWNDLPSWKSPEIDWVIVGGESGPGARPMHPDWARSLRDQCAKAGVAFHFKQWGDWAQVFDREVEDPDWRNCSRWEHAHPKGRWHNLAGGTGFHGERVIYVDHVGKKIAGRLLDGVEHNGVPELVA